MRNETTARLGLTFVGLGFLTSMPSLAGEGAGARMLELVGPGAKLTQTKRFIVAYDTSDEAVRVLTSRLEATYQALETYCRNNGLPFHPPEELLEVLFFESIEEFHQYARSTGFAAEGFNGFYSTATNRSAFFNISNHPGLEPIHREIRDLEARLAELNGAGRGNADREARKETTTRLRYLRTKRDQFVERLNRVVVQHETVHHVLHVVGVHAKGARNPQWFVEGIACVFETPPSSRGAGVGTTNQLRLADFRTACANESSLERLKPEDVGRAFERGKFVPLRRLITEPAVLQNAADGNLGNYYAQAWSVVFYLQRTQGKKLAEYAARVAEREYGREVSGEAELALFESIFGPLDADFERRWAKFILDLAFVPELTE